jgi:hypothetical protein
VCFFCDGNFPSYEAYTSELSSLGRDVRDMDSFLRCAQAADCLRFSTSAEWAEPALLEETPRAIFLNDDPDQGLLLFFLTCWLDMQARYTTVWSSYLRQTHRWLEESAWQYPDVAVPRAGFKAASSHLTRTVRALSSPPYDRSISKWFSSAVTRIVAGHGRSRGNLYRLVHRVCTDLYKPSSEKFVSHMAGGELPTGYSGPHYKRLWMLTMFLRRDCSAVRCLLSRALSTVQGG